MTRKPHPNNSIVAGPRANRMRHARRLAGLTQAELASRLGVGPSAVAQWELPNGTAPTVSHLAEVAVLCNVSFEWLATGRGAPTGASDTEVAAIDASQIALDPLEDRLLLAFRRTPARKREAIVRWLEDLY